MPSYIVSSHILYLFYLNTVEFPGQFYKRINEYLILNQTISEKQPFNNENFEFYFALEQKLNTCFSN